MRTFLSATALCPRTTRLYVLVIMFPCLETEYREVAVVPIGVLAGLIPLPTVLTITRSDPSGAEIRVSTAFPSLRGSPERNAAHMTQFCERFRQPGNDNNVLAMKTGMLYDEATKRMIPSTPGPINAMWRNPLDSFAAPFACIRPGMP